MDVGAVGGEFFSVEGGSGAVCGLGGCSMSLSVPLTLTSSLLGFSDGCKLQRMSDE